MYLVLLPIARQTSRQKKIFKSYFLLPVHFTAEFAEILRIDSISNLNSEILQSLQLNIFIMRGSYYYAGGRIERRKFSHMYMRSHLESTPIKICLQRNEEIVEWFARIMCSTMNAPSSFYTGNYYYSNHIHFNHFGVFHLFDFYYNRNVRMRKRVH